HHDALSDLRSDAGEGRQDVRRDVVDVDEPAVVVLPWQVPAAYAQLTGYDEVLLGLVARGLPQVTALGGGGERLGVDIATRGPCVAAVRRWWGRGRPGQRAAVEQHDAVRGDGERPALLGAGLSHDHPDR